MFLEDKSKSAGVTAPADPFSLEALIAWLRTKPGAARYDFHDCMGNCLIAQYMFAKGWDGYGQYSEFNREWQARNGYRIGTEIALPTPFTFGAALSRALAIQGAK